MNLHRFEKSAIEYYLMATQNSARSNDIILYCREGTIRCIQSILVLDLMFDEYDKLISDVSALRTLNNKKYFGTNIGDSFVPHDQTLANIKNQINIVTFLRNQNTHPSSKGMLDQEELDSNSKKCLLAFSDILKWYFRKNRKYDIKKIENITPEEKFKISHLFLTHSNGQSKSEVKLSNDTMQKAKHEKDESITIQSNQTKQRNSIKDLPKEAATKENDLINKNDNINTNVFEYFHNNYHFIGDNTLVQIVNTKKLIIEKFNEFIFNYRLFQPFYNDVIKKYLGNYQFNFSPSKLEKININNCEIWTKFPPDFDLLWGPIKSIESSKILLIDQILDSEFDIARHLLFLDTYDIDKDSKYLNLNGFSMSNFKAISHGEDNYFGEIKSNTKHGFGLNSTLLISEKWSDKAPEYDNFFISSNDPIFLKGMDVFDMLPYFVDYNYGVDLAELNVYYCGEWENNLKHGLGIIGYFEQPLNKDRVFLIGIWEFDELIKVLYSNAEYLNKLTPFNDRINGDVLKSDYILDKDKTITKEEISNLFKSNSNTIFY